MGIPTLISTSTASNSSSIDITSGIDSTYDEYMFVFTDINPATNAQFLRVAFSTDSGSSYTVACTATFSQAANHETSGWTVLQYVTAYDVAQSYPVNLHREIGSGADECSAGELFLFNPSSTTYVKHFYSTANSYGDSYTYNDFVAGYANTASAVDALQFTVTSGNFDGVIQMYGIA